MPSATPATEETNHAETIAPRARSALDGVLPYAPGHARSATSGRCEKQLDEDERAVEQRGVGQLAISPRKTDLQK